MGCGCNKKRTSPASRPLTSAGVSSTTTTQPRMQGTTQRY